MKLSWSANTIAKEKMDQSLPVRLREYGLIKDEETGCKFKIQALLLSSGKNARQYHLSQSIPQP